MKTSVFVVTLMLMTLTSATAICPNIAGDYYVVETYRIRVEPQGYPAEEQTGSGSDYVTIQQDACRFSYRIESPVGGNVVRRGTIDGLRITLDCTPLAVNPAGFQLTKNEFCGTGRIEEYRIVINGYGELVGTYQGVPFVMKVWSQAVLTGGQIVGHVATPLMTPAGADTHLDQNVTIQCATSGATIRYTLDGSEPTKTSTLYQGSIKLARSRTIKARAFRSDMLPSEVAANDFIIRSRWALLLHDMKSKPSVWDTFCDQYFPGPKIDIYGGVQKQTGKPLANGDGVRCYRVDFGFYDATKGRPGIGVTAVGDKQGDFCGFDVLGDEIAAAVRLILRKNPDSQIVLIGHGRGGLAARAFLQRAAYQDLTGNIAGLLTIGTAHQGSPLGRIYQYLSDHPTDVAWVPQFNATIANVRRPTVNDLAPGSTELTRLNENWALLPQTAQYGCLTYGGYPLGQVGTESIFTILPDAADEYILEGAAPEDHDGDGVVPVASQSLAGVVADQLPVTDLSIVQPTLHIDEPKKGADILTLWNTILDEWINE